MISVYLAGPQVFLLDPKRFFKTAKKHGLIKGLRIVSPLDGEEADKKPDAFKIFAENLQKISGCDAMIANISPFRGPSVDPGTAFEIGYAIALGKPVYAYTVSFREYKVRANQYVDYLYPTVEDFGLIDNLMITEGCRSISESLKEAMNMVASDHDV